MKLAATLSFFLFAGLVGAQSMGGRGYSTGEAWWNADWGGTLPWDENYDNPDGQVSITIRQRWIDSKGQDPGVGSQPLSHSAALAPKDVPNPGIRIEVLIDPTGCNLSNVYGLKSANPAVNVYRRPRVVANLDTLLSGPGSNAPVLWRTGASHRSKARGAMRC